MPESTATLLAVIATIALTIAAYICIIPEKKRATLPGIGKFFHDLFNFKWLLIEKIVKVCYVLSTIFVVCLGFFYLFSVQSDFWGGSHSLAGFGLGLIILGPIIVRIVYEFLMMSILMVTNIIEINKKMKGDAGTSATFNPNDYKTPKQNFNPYTGQPINNGQQPNMYQPNYNGQPQQQFNGQPQQNMYQQPAQNTQQQTQQQNQQQNTQQDIPNQNQ